MSDYISKSRLLNKVAGCHYDTEHPLESYASLVCLINGMETEDIEQIMADYQQSKSQRRVRSKTDATFEAVMQELRRE